MGVQKLRKEHKFFVYKHISPNNKVYIGITCKKNVTHRWGKNGSQYIKCPYFWHAIQKYGWDNIKHEILFTDLSEKEAKAKEVELIAFYKSNNPEFGYNLTEGGDGRCGYTCSEESREKMSKSHIGHKDSEETKRKKSLKRIGRKLTVEAKAKLSKNHSGIPKSEETKNKIRTTLRENSMFKKPVLQYNLNNEFIAEYSSASEVARILNLDSSGIRKAARGVYGHHKYKKYIWKEKQ